MATSLNILIVEDSEDDALLLARELRRGGYDADWERVDTAPSMGDALDRRQWDIVITDHNMPSFTSDAALALLRERDIDVPFIIVSGSIGEEVAVAAMKAGAHDYVMKDNMARLVPAIERELRDAQTRHAHRRAEQEIRHMAYHDALTDLLNRREFERCVTKALACARERNQDHALLYIDLDQFKIINDTCGHVAGDELLKQLSVVFQHHIREQDSLARLGGDEFGLLLENCPIERARNIAENIRERVKDFRFVWQDKPFSIGVSIGLVAITERSRDLNEIFSTADIACYTAKDEGRNRVHLYTDGDAEMARRHGDMQWVSRVQQALDEGRFLLYQQPIEALAAGPGAGACREFLLRLRDEAGRVVAPGVFIPAAERYNLMGRVDQWVIGAAFASITEAHARGPGATHFINLSGSSLNGQDFSRFVQKQLDRYRFPPGTVCFEITETAAIANLGKAVEFIREIKSAGCRFALDDFGSGLSSFSYLKTIPVDYLKIDGGFVRNMVNDPMDRAIVQSINQIGHVMGIETIAEFVENDRTIQMLRTLGVDYAQGYGIAKPRPLA